MTPHLKLIRGEFEFRVFPDRVEVEGPGHSATLPSPLVQLYYEFFAQLHNHLLEVKNAEEVPPA